MVRPHACELHWIFRHLRCVTLSWLQVTAGKIRDLARLKEAAVAAEEYDEAKRLKMCIERLKVRSGVGVEA